VAIFRYTARDRDGTHIEETLEASSAEAVATQLALQGVSPIKIIPEKQLSDPFAGLRARFVEKRVPLEELIAFCRQMHALSRAGIPILRSMAGLAETARNKTLGRAIADIGESLKSGRELSASFARYPRIFPELFSSVIQVGENTGRLDSSFEQLIRYLELERETRRRISSATRYPMLVVGAVACALVVINIFVVPVFSQTLSSFGVALPWPTRLMIATSNGFVRFWPWMLAAGVAMVAAGRHWLATPEGRLLYDHWKMSFPVFGPIIRRATVARYARAFAMTFNAGLPILRALDVAARSAENAWISARVHAMGQQIERGDTLTRASATSGLFEPLFLQMIGVGEETGSLGDMHIDIAVSYEAEVDYDLRRMSELLEPILIVGVGGVVLLLALAVYLPLWSLSSGISGG
jgi:MSHA biogenesis protein MshG